MDQMQGTPITRSGGYMIRVGWRAVAYSVERAVEEKYRRLQIILLILAVGLGGGAALLVYHLFLTVIIPLAGHRLPMLVNYVNIWPLLIYGTALVSALFFYRLIMAVVGKRMVRGLEAKDAGFGFMEQRRRVAWVKRRWLIVLALILALIIFVPVEFKNGQRLFMALLFGYLFFEGLFFRYINAAKK